MAPTVLDLRLREVTGHESKSAFDFDLFHPMRHFIRLGTLLGIIPLNIGSNSTFHTFRWISWPVFASFFGMTLVGANAVAFIYTLVDKLRSFDLSKTHLLVEFTGASLLNVHSLFTYIHFMRKATVFRNITKKWRTTSMKLSFRGLKGSDSEFSRLVNLIGFGCMVSIILENAFFHLKIFPICVSPEEIDLKEGEGSWEYYYFHGQRNFVKLGIPYNPIFTFLIFVGNKLIIYTSTYSDISIILMAKAVHLKYRRLVEETCVRMNSFYWKDSLWPTLYKDYILHAEVADEIERFLSPMVFISFIRSVAFLITLIQQGLAFHPNVCWWYEPIYRSWIAIHFFTLLFLMCHFSAQIADEQHKLRKLLDVDLSVFKHVQVRRLEYFLSNPPTFTGLGYFRTVRPFIIAIGNAILTFEVLILQTSSYTSEAFAPAGPTITGNSSRPLKK